MRVFLAVSLLVLLTQQLCDTRSVWDEDKEGHKSYGRNLPNTIWTPKASIKHDLNIAPWLASYEGKTIEERQVHRHRILNQVCNSMENSAIEKFSRAVLVNDQNKLVFCYIPKVGSYTLLSTILEANRLTLQLQKGEFNVHNLPELERYGIRRLETYSKEEQERILRTHYKFLFVRHPLLRLRSAHRMFTNAVREGLSTQNHSTFFNISAGLVNGISNLRDKGFPLFGPFLHLLSSEWNKVKEAQNEHFNNFQNLCSPCHINYDFIGKHENFAEELNYILEKRLPNAELVKSKISKTHWIEMDQVYQNLTKETKDLFLNRYGNDFRLFNYKY